MAANKNWMQAVACSGMIVLFSILNLNMQAQSANDERQQNVVLNTAKYSETRFITEPRHLSVGDKVPDIKIENIINFPSASANISDFKGKLILIDFWETYCSNCIAALPKIDSLQQKFKDKIQVITVTRYGNKEQVNTRLKRFKKTKDLNLPIVIGDEVLHKYFPFELVSHVVWIGGDGNVKAITGTEYITAENIQSILEVKEVNWPVKNDVLGFDYTQALLTFPNNDIATPPDFTYYSALTGRLDGVEGTNRKIVDSVKGTITFNYFNQSLIQLCNGVVNNAAIGGAIDRKHLILEVKDSLRYFKEKSEYKTIWKQNNTFCYSITLPLNLTRSEIEDIIRNDIKRWLHTVFKISVKKEKRLVECLLLVRTNADDNLLKSRGGEYINTFIEPDDAKRLVNADFSTLAWHLAYAPELPWVFDETGIRKEFKIDLEINLRSFENLPLLRKELQRYGLDLIETKKEMEVVIIAEDGFESQSLGK